MVTLFTDLDGTMISSDKKAGKCIEWKEGREITYAKDDILKRLEMLEAGSDSRVIPVTTRSIEKYSRIQLPDFEFALVANGGILLENGKVDECWYQTSKYVVKRDRDRLLQAEHDFKTNGLIPKRVDELFVYAVAENTEQALDVANKIDAVRVGRKLYVIPRGLAKGDAISRLRERIDTGHSIAAGDSKIDFSMADEVNEFITCNGSCSTKNCRVEDREHFPDRVLTRVESIVK